LKSASIDAIDPAIVKLPVSKNDMINVAHIDNNRYDSDLYMWICNAFRSLSPSLSIQIIQSIRTLL